MKKSKKKDKAYNIKYNRYSKGGYGGCAYFLGFIGAVVYYIQTATSFWGGVVGFLKAIVWPAFVVYDLLRFIAA